MSGGTTCKCPESKKPMAERKWRVLQRHCNHSAFNGYKYTYSEWSAVTCLCCPTSWRTKADYVNKLQDYNEKEPRE